MQYVGLRIFIPQTVLLDGGELSGGRMSLYAPIYEASHYSARLYILIAYVSK